MSVTFAAEYRESDVIGFHIVSVCGCTSLAYSTGAQAEEAYGQLPGFSEERAHIEGCQMDEQDWAIFRPHIEAIEAHDRPSINLGNANARGLLELLGLPTDDLCGEISAQDLLGRILLAQALASGDVGRPSTRETTVGGATLVDCGRSEGYFDSRLRELAPLAEWAAEHDRLVIWG